MLPTGQKYQEEKSRKEKLRHSLSFSPDDIFETFISNKLLHKLYFSKICIPRNLLKQNRTERLCQLFLDKRMKKNEKNHINSI